MGRTPRPCGAPSRPRRVTERPAIRAFDEALAAWEWLADQPNAPSLDPMQRVETLGRSGLGRLSRHGASGAAADLDHAIAWLERLVAAALPGAPALGAALNNLAAFFARHGAAG